MSHQQGKVGCLQAIESMAKTLESLAKIVALAVGLPVIALLLWSGGEEELPIGIAEMCADLERAKTVAEGLCRIAQADLDGRGRDAELADGRYRYLRARADLDALIGWTTARMLVGFQGGDASILNTKWAGARKGRQKFFDWCTSPESPDPPPVPKPKTQDGQQQYGDVVTDALAAAVELNAQKSSRREQAVAELSKRLEGCRWRPWEELGPPPRADERPIRSESMRPALPELLPRTPARGTPLENSPPARAGDEPWLPEEPDLIPAPCPSAP